MEESTNTSPVPSNCTSPVCSDPAHDDLALDSEWSDENRDCDGDGPHRVVEESPSHEDPDVRVRDDEVREVRQDLLRLSGANAPEILKVCVHGLRGVPLRLRRWVSTNKVKIKMQEERFCLLMTDDVNPGAHL